MSDVNDGKSGRPALDGFLMMTKFKFFDDGNEDARTDVKTG